MQTIREWRNLQMDILRQNEEITESQQRKYFKEVIDPSFTQTTPSQVLFSILKDKKLIGYGGLVHIDWEAKTAEISFLLEPALNNHIRSFTENFDEFLVFIQKIAYTHLELDKIYTYAYDIRTYVYPPLEKHGFVCEARLRNHIKIGDDVFDVVIHSKIKGQTGKSIPQKLSILVTSLSKKVPLVNSIREMFEENNINAVIHGGDASSDTLGKYFVDHFWEMPNLNSLQIEDVLNYCQKHSISIIIPTRDAELEYWAVNKSILKKHNIYVMISPKSTILQCYDKFQFFQKLHKASFPVIETVISLKSNVYERYVVKSRFGSGSRTTFIDIPYEVVRSIIDKENGYIIQPYIDGIEYSIDCYRSSKNGAVHSVVRSRDIVLNGESAVSTIKNDEIEIKQIIEKASTFLNIQGHCVFQGIRSETSQEFLLLECNPRVGGASSLSMKAGLTSILWFASEAKLIHIDSNDFYPKEVFSKMIRVPKDFYI